MALVGPGLNPMQEPWSQLGYLHHSSTQDDVKGVTHWVVANIDSQVYSLPTFIPTSVFLCVRNDTLSIIVARSLPRGKVHPQTSCMSRLIQYLESALRGFSVLL